MVVSWVGDWFGSLVNVVSWVIGVVCLGVVLVVDLVWEVFGDVFEVDGF